MKTIETGNSRAGFQDHLLLFLVAIVILVAMCGLIRGILFFGTGVALLVLFNLVIMRSLVFLIGKWDSRKSTASAASEGVILLHGLCRTDRSMTKMALALESAGYAVVNVDYPSRTATVETLAETVIAGALADPRLATATQIHFVTHSLGGILVRQYLKSNDLARLGRVVMLGPPNQGSEIFDRLGDFVLFEKIHGPSGSQLGTGANSLPTRLGAVDFELGVIAVDRSINWINSLRRRQ